MTLPPSNDGSRVRHRPGEAGFTVIEALVAMVLAILSIGAVAELFVTGNDSSLSAQRQTQLLAVADRQIEQIRQLVKTNPIGFAALAMSAAPAAGTSATLTGMPNVHTDPNYFVTAAAGCGPNAGGYQIEANFDNTSEGTSTTVPAFSSCPAAVEPLVVRAGGIVLPKQTGVVVGSGTATVYGYVTATNIGCAGGSADYVAGVAGSCYADARRVVVAVLLDTPGGRTNVGQASPAYVSTIFTNPVPSNQPNSSIGLTLGLNIG